MALDYEQASVMSGSKSTQDCLPQECAEKVARYSLKEELVGSDELPQFFILKSTADFLK